MLCLCTKIASGKRYFLNRRSRLFGRFRQPLLTAGADREQAGECADFEQAPKLGRQAAQDELALALVDLLAGNQQRAKSRAADIDDVPEIDDQVMRSERMRSPRRLPNGFDPIESIGPCGSMMTTPLLRLSISSIGPLQAACERSY